MNWTKRIALTCGLTLAFFAGSMAGPAASPAYMTESEAGNTVISWTQNHAISDYNAAFAPFGIPQCGTHNQCWRFDGATYQDAHRTSDNVIWVTANHFAAFGYPDTCARRWRVRWRGRVEKDPVGVVTDVNGFAVSDMSRVEAVTKIAGTC